MICEFSACSKTVPPDYRPSKPRRFCSVTCRNRWINEKHKTKEIRACSWCGKSFVAQKVVQRYCARPCRLEACAPTATTEQTRFWSYVDKDGPVPAFRSDLGPCWLWTGQIDEDGYGIFTTNGSRTIRAHRFAIGADGPSTDHLCRVRPCVRSEHLESVTVRVNTLRGDGPAALNARKTHCYLGHFFDEGNTYVSRDGRRFCQTCASERSRLRNIKLKNARKIKAIKAVSS